MTDDTVAPEPATEAAQGDAAGAPSSPAANHAAAPVGSDLAGADYPAVALGDTDATGATSAAYSPDRPGTTETTDAAFAPDRPGATETTSAAYSPDRPGTTETTDAAFAPDRPGATETTSAAYSPDRPGTTETTDAAFAPDGTGATETTGAAAGTGETGGPARPSLARSTGVMMAGTLLSRLTGFVRTVVLAAVLGKSLMADSYNVANTLPNIVYDMILGGVLAATLIPVFVQRLTRYDRRRQPPAPGAAGTSDEDQPANVASADRTTAATGDGPDPRLGAPPGPATDGDDDPVDDIAAVTTLILIIGVLTSVGVFVAAPWLVRLYFNRDVPAEGLEVGTALLRMFAPQVLFYTMTATSTALLQARRRFGPPMFAPVANNVVVIVMLLTLDRFVSATAEVQAFLASPAALWYLGLGTTAGVAAMALIQSWYLRRADVPLRLRWAPGAPAVRKVLSLSGWTLGFVAATQLAYWQITKLATAGGRGDYSAYTYSQIFFQLPFGVFAVSVMSAIQPDLAEFWHERRLDRFAARFGTGMRSIVAIMTPAAVGMSLLATPLVLLLLQRGNLNREGALVTAGTLAVMSLALPGYSVFQQLGRAFQAMEDTRTLFFVYLVYAGFNIVLAYLLHPIFGIQGLAGAFAASYTLTALVALALLRLKLGRGVGVLAGLAGHLGRVLVASAVMGAGVYALVWLAGPYLDRRMVQIGVLAAGSAAGGVLFLVLAHFLGVPEPGRLVGGLLGPVRRRLSHRGT